MDDKFLSTLPSMFATEIQKAALSHFLWNGQSPEKIVDNLRMYDIVRRIYYVRVGEDPSPDEILRVMKQIETNKPVKHFLMRYIRGGRFPDTGTLRRIAI